MTLGNMREPGYADAALACISGALLTSKRP